MYAMIDGDDIGIKMEFHILRNDVESFIKQSEKINNSMRIVLNEIRSIEGVNILSTGGDSALAELEEGAKFPLTRALGDVQGVGGFHFSAGIGWSLRECYIALRMAKAAGKSKIVTFPIEP